MPVFPSKEWFQALQTAADTDPDRYRRLGTIDLVLVAQIDTHEGSRCFELTFSGYRCEQVREIRNPAEAGPEAIVLEGPEPAWREMIRSIQHYGRADLEHTLNTLTLADWPLRVRAENQLAVDQFYRYQESLQEFFDEAACFDTEFAESQRGSAV